MYYRLMTDDELWGASRRINLQFNCKCGRGVQLDTEWGAYICECGRQYFARIMAEVDESAIEAAAYHATTGE